MCTKTLAWSPKPETQWTVDAFALKLLPTDDSVRASSEPFNLSIVHSCALSVPPIILDEQDLRSAICGSLTVASPEAWSQARCRPAYTA